MALTRKYLKSLGLTEDQIDGIIEEHSSTVEGLKETANKYKADADKLPAVQKELDDIKAAGDGGYKEKYEAEVRAHQEYKAQIEGEKTLTAKRAALDAFLRDKVSIQREEARNLILDATKYDDIKLDDKGGIAEAETLSKSYGEKYASFVSKPGVAGTPPNTPPSGGNTRMTKEQIVQIKNPAERRAAIAANIDLFN